MHQYLWWGFRAFRKSPTISSLCITSWGKTWTNATLLWIYWWMCMCAHTHGCAQDRAYLYVCVYLCCLSVCASSSEAHTAEFLVCRYSCLFYHCVRLMAFFPGSSHLPTLLLFVAFQSWEKQRQLVGSTANPQGQAVFLQKRVEYTHSTRSRPEGAIQATSQDSQRRGT